MWPLTNVAFFGHVPFVTQPATMSDPEDGLVFMSAYQLRRSFEFCTLFQRGSLVLCDIHPYGPFVVVNVFSVASLVEHFPFLTLKDLVEIGRSHFMTFTKSVRKDDVRSALLAHTCNHACER